MSAVRIPGRDTPATDRPEPAEPVSTAHGALLVAEREIVTQVRTKSFVVSLIITLALAFGGILLSGFLADRGQDATPVAVVGGAQTALGEVEGLDLTAVDDLVAAEELVRSEEVDAAVVADDTSPVGLRVIALRDAPGDVIRALAEEPPVELLDASSSSGLRVLVSMIFGLLFMVFAMGSGAMIVQNTVQEKQSRIVEILLSAVPARSLLGGKVLGNTVLAVGQTAAIGAVAVLGLLLTGQGELLDMLTGPIVWFVIFFLVGFVLVAAMFASGAALVSRQEDTGAVMMPTMMLIMSPYFVVIFLGENALAMTIASYVPFSAPVAMPVRMFLGEASWWEPVVSLGVLGLSATLTVALAARIYSNSLLRTGPRVSLKSALGRS